MLYRRLAAPVAARRFEALRRCRVVLGVLALLAAGLTASPQAADLLITLGQTSAAPDWAAMAAGTAWLSLNAWFWARVSLAADRDDDIRREHPMLPDLLAAAAFWIVSAGLWSAARGVPASMLAEMGPLAGGAERLRIGAALLAAGGLAALAAGLLTRREPARGGGPTAFMALLSAGVALAGMAAYGSDPVAAAALIPPGAAVLCAASGLICGGTLLVRAGRATRLPVLLTVFLAGAGLAVLRDRDVLPDNHDVRRLPDPPRARRELQAAFLNFLARAEAAGGPEGGPVPVTLAASSGGGIAAAYWTAAVLGDLADASPAFAGSLFAVSGVSGGALGALEYAAALGEPACRDTGLRRCLRAALGGDFLGPVLGALMYPDLFQRFVPFILFPDREAALEQAWERRWRASFGDDRIGGPFLDLWRPGEPWPALLLNGTSLATGGRLLTSNLALPDGWPDLLATMQADVRASTAAGNSARFPYISPLGAVRRAGVRVDAVGDGGYFENLGATTLLDLLDLLDATAKQAGRAVRFVVVQIVSDPDVGPDGSLAPSGMAASASSLLPIGLTGPAEVLLETRAARGVYATAALARRTAALGGAYVPVRLGRSPTGAAAPLGWALSAVAREVIDAQWTPGCRASVLEAAGFGQAPAAGSDGMTVPAMWRAADCSRDRQAGRAPR